MLLRFCNNLQGGNQNIFYNLFTTPGSISDGLAPDCTRPTNSPAFGRELTQTTEVETLLLQRLIMSRSKAQPGCFAACCHQSAPESRVMRRKFASLVVVSIAAFLVFAFQLSAREKDAIHYGMGLIVNLPFPENEVSQVLQDVVQNGIIRGTKEYNKDEYVSGAIPAESTKVFPEWKEGGKVFYKVRLNALDPRNFKDSGDMGTLAVRYVVQPQGEKNTILRIDAVFVEDFRHVSHASNGSVEGAEYKDIHDRLEAIEAIREETIEAEKAKQDVLAKRQRQPAGFSSSNETHAAAPASVASSNAVPNNPPTESAQLATQPPEQISVQNDAQTPEQHLEYLRHQLERLVKSPGAPLKSAPFHSASTLQTLPTGTEVLIVVTTTYWLGVETHEGQHGWILRDELEQLP
jgi:hypothetical protein